MGRAILLGLFASLFTQVLLAQDTYTATGQVRAPRDVPVSGALVRVVNLDLATQTDSAGAYSLGPLPPGRYLLRVSRPGFGTRIVPLRLPASETDSIAPGLIVLEEARRSLDEVTVTAEKREQPIQQVPASISVLDANEIAAFRLWNLSELSGIVPTLYSADPGDNRNVTSIRGITTTSYDPAVAVYIDGVSQFGLDTYIGELLEPERIEVLRGPQSTLYGRNASGGVINIITRQPSMKRSAFAEISAGAFGLQRYKAGVKTPLGKQLLLGASGMYSRTNGYYTNTFDNSHYDRQSVIAGNYFLKWHSTNRRWNLTLNAKHQHTRNQGAFPLVYGVEEALRNPFKLSQNAPAEMRDAVWNASAALRYAGRGFELHSQTAWQSNSRIYQQPIDGDFSPADAIRIDNNFGSPWNRVQVLTQELRINSPARKEAGGISWTGGTYLFYQHNPVKQATLFGRDAALMGSPDSLYRIVNASTGRNSGLAVFGQLSLPITARLRLTGGLRYDYQLSRLELRSDYVSDKGDPSFPIQGDTSGRGTFGAVSPKAGLLYSLDTRNSVYVNYSRGFRSGGLTQLGSDPSQPALSPFKPEYSNNFEAGIKSAFWNNRVRLNASGFYISATDVQVPSLVLPEAYTITRNTGALRSFGAEAELTAILLTGLRLQWNAGYTDARYTALRLASNGTEQNYEGKRQIFTPEYSSAVVMQYERPLGGPRRLALVLRGEWLRFGRQYFDAANTITQAPYSLLNARVALQAPAAELSLWLRNAGDTRYIDYAYDFGAVHLGNPRIWGASLALRID